VKKALISETPLFIRNTNQPTPAISYYCSGFCNIGFAERNICKIKIPSEKEGKIIQGVGNLKGFVFGRTPFLVFKGLEIVQ
jgi:hypothetical protein